MLVDDFTCQLQCDEGWYVGINPEGMFLECYKCNVAGCSECSFDNKCT